MAAEVLRQRGWHVTLSRGSVLADDPSTGATSSALDTLFGVVQEGPEAGGLVEESRLGEIRPAGSPHLNRT